MPSFIVRLVYSAVFLGAWVVFLAFRVMFKRFYNYCFNWGGSIKSREPDELPPDIEESIDLDLEIDTESEPEGEHVSRGWFQNWSMLARRSPRESQRIIQQVFSVRPTNTSQWDLDISDTESKYLAVPARMTFALNREDLSRGIFTGDSTDHFNNIHRISQIKRPQLELTPVSSNYISTEILRPPGLLNSQVSSPKTVHSIGMKSKSSRFGQSRSTQTTSSGSKYRPIHPTSTVSSLSANTAAFQKSSLKPSSLPKDDVYIKQDSVHSSGSIGSGGTSTAPLPVPSRVLASPDLCQSPNTTPPRLRAQSCPPVLDQPVLYNVCTPVEATPPDSVEVFN